MTVKAVRCDNAPELSFAALFQSKGIMSYHSCPETPEQNSVVERKHQRILNVARALMFQSNVPLNRWGDCVMTAVFLINRTPATILKNKSPYELMMQESPRYDQLKVFGCLCYSSTSPKGRHKFQPRSRACVFLGYPSGYKGYKLMDLETHDVFISRNVIFHENVFPLTKGKGKGKGKENQDNPFIDNHNDDNIDADCWFSNNDVTGTEHRRDFSTNNDVTETEKTLIHDAGTKEVPNVTNNEENAETVNTDFTANREEFSLLKTLETVLDISKDTNITKSCHDAGTEENAKSTTKTTLDLDTTLINNDYDAGTKETERSLRNDMKAGDDDLNGTFLPDHSNDQRVTRTRKPPIHLNDYLCYSFDSKAQYPISANFSYSKLSADYFSYINNITKIPEPQSYSEAKVSEEWLTAMGEEFDAMERNDTWEIVCKPKDKKPIGCRWVYTVKYNSDGSLERYKARLVAKGFTQQEGLDYNETFSPVAKLVTVKLLLSVASAKHWHLRQLDVSNAFLNGDLDEEIFMSLPQGYIERKKGKVPENAVCRLKRSIYGLKQASRQWFLKFSSALLDLGFTKAYGDHTLFMKKMDQSFIAVLVYVDDIIIASTTMEDADILTSDLQKSFKLRDLGNLKYFLGLEVARTEEGISLCQRKYALEMLSTTGMMGCKTVSTPMEANLKISKNDGEVLEDQELYRSLVGRLMYLTITRPDITFAVNKLCQYSSAPTKRHLQAVYRILQYIKGTLGQGLFYSSQTNLELKGYADSDWASCSDSRRSTTGFAMFIGTSLVSWRSKKQQTVSRSSAEAEYRALALASCELMWLKTLLQDLQVEQPTAPILYSDSTAAIHIASNPVFHERTKHIEVDCHTVREKLDQGMLRTLHVRTENQLADILTKPLYPHQFNSLKSKMSLCNIYGSS